MGHFAFVVPPFVGHLNPMSALARATMRRGHRVTMLTSPDGESILQRAGLEVVLYGQRRFPPGEWNRRMTEIGKCVGRTSSARSISLIHDQARTVVEELPALFPQLKPDGVVMDQVSFGVESVAAAQRIPLAVACNAMPLHREKSVPPYIRAWRYEANWWAYVRNTYGNVANVLSSLRVFWELSRFRRRVGLRIFTLKDFNELPPSLAQVAQMPAFLDFPRRQLPDHFHHTGPWHEPASSSADNSFPWEKLDSRPLIYASLGTLQNRVDQIYFTITAACADLPVQLVLALGRTAGALAKSFPGSPLVVDYAPQLQLLKRASLVITHAGMNTALETLKQAVPMVAIPITNDQPGVAARLQRIGVAEMVTLNALSVPRLREAIQRVLSEPSYRERSAWAACELERIDGLSMASEIIERAFTEQRRVVRTA